MTYACRSQGLGKRYRVSRAAPRGNFGYRTLQEELIRLAWAPLRRLRGGPFADRSEDFWALRDTDFEIQPGEVVGIIGRNGAGKSTLLKILSRITKPTTGQVELKGRVGSLLEVGTGFHPELTGRENIYLNGAILGMSRREIDRKFDEIVAFAEVERFLETPVKRYSSGMYVRLAFAVSAHLEPEILIVDEVLAVGDMAFQRKCMGRMREVGHGGRAVLFVSHNMAAIEALCSRAILLEEGRVTSDGDVQEVIREYRRRIMAPQLQEVAHLRERRGPGRRQRVFCAATLLDEAGAPTNFVPLGGLFHLRIGLDTPTPLRDPVLTVGVDDTMGQRILSVVSHRRQETAIGQIVGHCEVDCRVEQFPLAPGDYWIKLGLAAEAGVQVDDIEHVLHLSVINGEAFNEGRGFHLGLCLAPSRWSIAPVPDPQSDRSFPRSKAHDGCSAGTDAVRAGQSIQGMATDQT